MISKTEEKLTKQEKVKVWEMMSKGDSLAWALTVVYKLREPVKVSPSNPKE